MARLAALMVSIVVPVVLSLSSPDTAVHGVEISLAPSLTAQPIFEPIQAPAAQTQGTDTSDSSRRHYLQFSLSSNPSSSIVPAQFSPCPGSGGSTTTTVEGEYTHSFSVAPASVPIFSVPITSFFAEGEFDPAFLAVTSITPGNIPNITNFTTSIDNSLGYFQVSGDLVPPTVATASNGTLAVANFRALAETSGTQVIIPEYTVHFTTGTSSCQGTATVIIQPSPSPDPPVAIDDSASTLEDTPVTIDVAANDTDGDGNLDPNSANSTCANGSAGCLGAANGYLTDHGDGTITYTPNANFNGSDSFVYEICDTDNLCATATVNITVDPVSTSFSCNNVTEIPTSECEALVVLYNSTNGANWIYNTGWLVTNTPCSWSGVFCSYNHVVILGLGGDGLSGNIPPELGNLTNLLALNLCCNQLSGTIPTQLGNLSTLIELKLFGNQLSGTIPSELGNLINLVWLWLHHNQLDGALPASLINLTQLDSFWFNNTDLCEPGDADFQTWLAGIAELQRTGVPCTPSDTTPPPAPDGNLTCAYDHTSGGSHYYKVTYSWTAVTDNGTAGMHEHPYWSQISKDSNFFTLADPGWYNSWDNVTSRTSTIAFIEDTELFGHVKARDAYDNQSNWSWLDLLFINQSNCSGVPSSPPTANFSANPTLGSKPLTVNFTDQSTGDISSWSWDFGDGATSTQQHPSHTYANAGSYTVSLTVSGPGGSDMEAKTNYITVGEPDTVPPAGVSDLASAPDINPGLVKLSWTAPGDDGSGGEPAAQYDIRYSNAPIGDSNWENATQVDGEPLPANPGTTQQMLFVRLATGVKRYFAIKTTDESGNVSALSNVPSLRDAGFRPIPHGYKFSNDDILGWGYYPITRGQEDYTIDDMIEMFGRDAVCWTVVNGDCIPKMSARRWLDEEVHQKMNGGHCDGFTSTSLRFFTGDDPSQYQGGATSAYDLTLDNARRHISRYHVIGLLAQVIRPLTDSFRQTPSFFLNQLHAAMSGTVDNPWTLVIYKDTTFTSGHSVVPYAIQERGNRIWWVWVYDSNHPDDADRYVEINSAAETWRYDRGNNEVWSGSFDPNPPNNPLNSTLGGIPISLYDQKPRCPEWCATAITSMDTRQSSQGAIWLSGKGHLLITDSQGRRIGFAGDQLINEIPEAISFTPIGGLGIPQEPIYHVPLIGTNTILLDGQTLARTETAAVTQFGSGYAVSVDDVRLQPTSQDQMTVAPDGTGLTYQPNETREVTLTLALDSPNASYKLQIQKADVGAGQQVEIAADTTQGKLSFISKDADGGTYNLLIERVNDAGLQTFAHNDLVVSSGDTHYVDYSVWDGLGAVTVSIDHGSDGTVDQTMLLDNQTSRGFYLPIIVR